jgi:hypothetical protein
MVQKLLGKSALKSAKKAAPRGVVPGKGKVSKQRKGATRAREGGGRAARRGGVAAALRGVAATHAREQCGLSATISAYRSRERCQVVSRTTTPRRARRARRTRRRALAGRARAPAAASSLTPHPSAITQEISRLINQRNEETFARKATQSGGGLSLVRAA